MRVVVGLRGITGEEVFQPIMPLGPYLEGTDIGFMAKVVSGTAEVDVDFEILLRDKE